MDAVWAAYAETVLDFPAAELALDLRQPLGAAARSRLAALGLSGPFAVITACNPLGRVLDDPANRALSRVLDALVRERHPGARPAHGRSPDRSHREPGWAIPLPLAEAERLAAGFFQNALYWFDGTGFVIVPVHAPGPRLRLPAPR